MKRILLFGIFAALMATGCSVAARPSNNLARDCYYDEYDCYADDYIGYFDDHDGYLDLFDGYFDGYYGNGEDGD